MNRMVSNMEEEPGSEWKFIPHVPVQESEPRHRLMQAISVGLRGRLVLLVAPPGHGKSSLMASVASQWSRFDADGALRLAWYSLDETDDDPAVFMEGLVRAVRRAVPGFGRELCAVLRHLEDVRTELHRVMDLFLDELRGLEPTRVFIFLDGFHHLSDPSVVEAVERALRNPGSPLRLIVASQVQPRLYLSVLRSEGALAELRTEDLLWDPDEARRLLARGAGRPVDPFLLDRLAKETGGWPSAVSMTSMILRFGSERHLLGRIAPTEHGYELLLRELLSSLPGGFREDLLRSSLLPWLDPVSCREGVGIEEPGPLLESLLEMGFPVFRPMGRSLPLFCEPHFWAALRRELSRRLLPHEYSGLQRRVAEYLGSAGARRLAISRCLAMGDHEQAALMIEGMVAAAGPSGAADLPLRWTRALPRQVRNGHPVLAVAEAGLLLRRGRVDEARAALVVAEREAATAQDRKAEGRRLVYWADVHQRDRRYGVAMEAARRAAEILPVEDSLGRAMALRLEARALEHLGSLSDAFVAAAGGLLDAELSGRQEMVVEALLQLGCLAGWMGHHQAALALSGRAVQRAALYDGESVAMGRAASLASVAYLDRGLPDHALVAAERGLAAAQRLRDALGTVRSRTLLAAALERLGDAAWDDVLGMALEEAEKLPGDREESAAALLLRAVSLSRRGKGAEAETCAQRSLDGARACRHQPLADQAALVLATRLVRGPRVAIGLRLALRLADAFARSGSARWLSMAHQTLATAYDRLGLQWRAARHLGQALSISAEQGFVGASLDPPADRERLLLLAVRKAVGEAEAASLLGVAAAGAEGLLAPIARANGDPGMAERARRAMKGAERGAAALRVPRVAWPDLHRGAVVGRSRVALHSLGRFWASVDGEVVDWPSADARDLAAFLLVHRCRATPRDDVLRGVWVEEGLAVANVRLHVALYRLREALGPGYPPVDPLLEGTGTYRWDGEGCGLDLEEFRSMVADAARMLEGESPPVLSEKLVSLLENAASIYHGELLEGLPFDWCVAPREELRGRLLWLARLLMDHYMALRRWRDAIRVGLQSLKSDPLQEDVVRDLMVCYFREGDRRSADGCYRELKRKLARDRGTMPSAATVRLYMELLGAGALWVRRPSIEPSVSVVRGAKAS